MILFYNWRQKSIETIQKFYEKYKNFQKVDSNSLGSKLYKNILRYD